MIRATFADLETTGKLTPDHRIIEAAFRRCTIEDFREVENLLLRINPERNIDAKAQAVHGISIDELKGEPNFKARIPEIKRVFENTDLIVWHNGISFDMPFLKMEFERHGETLPDVAVFDTMVEGTFATDLGKSPTLFELCWSLGVEYDPAKAHKGDYDTLVLRESFFNGLRYGWFKM